MAYEESFHKTVSRTDIFEVRHYPERGVAEVAYRGENSGFHILFDYISGNNKTAQTVEINTAFTRSTKIDMTTPVTQTKSDDQLVMRFFLPVSFTLQTAPKQQTPLSLSERWLPIILPQFAIRAGRMIAILQSTGLSFWMSCVPAR